MHPKEGVSFEEFDNHWMNVHSKLFTSLDIFHFSPQINAAIISHTGAPAAPYYGIAIFEAESFEKIFEVFADPEYLRVIVPDEEKFFVRTKSSMVGGPFAEIVRG